MGLRAELRVVVVVSTAAQVGSVDVLTADGILRKRKVGRTNFYMNVRLLSILAEARRRAFA